MTQDSTTTREQILERMQVPGRPHQYVLGCFESRITLYTKQVRALNFIYALDGVFRQGGASVIGAGAGRRRGGVAKSRRVVPDGGRGGAAQNGERPFHVG